MSVDIRVNRISAISGHMHRLEERRKRRGTSGTPACACLPNDAYAQRWRLIRQTLIYLQPLAVLRTYMEAHAVILNWCLKRDKWVWHSVIFDIFRSHELFWDTIYIIMDIELSNYSKFQISKLLCKSRVAAWRDTKVWVWHTVIFDIFRSSLLLYKTCLF